MDLYNIREKIGIPAVILTCLFVMYLLLYDQFSTFSDRKKLSLFGSAGQQDQTKIKNIPMNTVSQIRHYRVANATLMYEANDPGGNTQTNIVSASLESKGHAAPTNLVSNLSKPEHNRDSDQNHGTESGMQSFQNITTIVVAATPRSSSTTTTTAAAATAIAAAEEAEKHMSSEIFEHPPVKETTHIAFLKVHKAASSTVQNILYRFGLQRDLSFVLPVYSHYISKEKYVLNELMPALLKDIQKVEVKVPLLEEGKLPLLDTAKRRTVNDVERITNKEIRLEINPDELNRETDNQNSGSIEQNVNDNAKELHEEKVEESSDNTSDKQKLKDAQEGNTNTDLEESEKFKSEETEIEIWKYDILCNHIVFNYKEISNLMYNDTVYIGIVREPLDLFLSAAYYYRYVWDVNYLKLLPEKTFITDLIHNPEVFEPLNISKSKTFNSMAYDFGLDFKSVADASAISEESFDKFLHEIGDIFQFGMTVEKFDESLVLLKRRLGWSLRDIIYVENNAYLSSTDTNVSATNITDEDKTIFRSRNKFDYAIYEFFKKRLDQQLSEEPDLSEEVVYFKDLLQLIKNFCNERNTQQVFKVSESKWNTQFSLTSSDCDLMTKDELSFWQDMKNRHQELLKETMSP